MEEVSAGLEEVVVGEKKKKKMKCEVTSPGLYSPTIFSGFPALSFCEQGKERVGILHSFWRRHLVLSLGFGGGSLHGLPTQSSHSFTCRHSHSCHHPPVWSLDLDSWPTRTQDSGLMYPSLLLKSSSSSTSIREIEEEWIPKLFPFLPCCIVLLGFVVLVVVMFSLEPRVWII